MRPTLSGPSTRPVPLNDCNSARLCAAMLPGFCQASQGTACGKRLASVGGVERMGRITGARKIGLWGPRPRSYLFSPKGNLTWDLFGALGELETLCERGVPSTEARPQSAAFNDTGIRRA